MNAAARQIEDESMMRRALALAKRGRGSVEPNPMVGCVIAKDAHVISEGFHGAFGGPHAEAHALAAASMGAAGAAVYVTLEPCCHTEKKTPPCVPRLIAARVRRVVVACEDPNPAVAGKGLRQLREAGVEVSNGICEAEARQLNSAFFALTIHHRPYVTLKWAQSADGMVGIAGKGRVWISNAASRRVVHELRARSDAILVGINTVRMDDPLLTARAVAGARTLTRAVLDTHLSLSTASRLVRTAQEGPVVVFCSEAAVQNAGAANALRERSVEVVPLPLGTSGRLPIADVLAHLGTRGVTHLLVEPGPTVARSFLDGGHADRIWTFQSPQKLEVNGAPLKAAGVPYPAVGRRDIAGDSLTEYLNPASLVFFASVPSVDLQLAGATS